MKNSLKLLPFHIAMIANSSQRALNRLQRVMNAAARLVCHSGRLTPVSGLLCDRLHYLRVPERVGYKLCLLVFKALHGTEPEYLSELYQSKAEDTARSWLRSAAHGDLQVPRSKTDDQLWWSSIRSHQASVIEQTTSNNPVIWHSSEFEKKLKAHFFWWTISFSFPSSRAQVPLNWTPCNGV